MMDRLKQQMAEIDIPETLQERTLRGVKQAKVEMNGGRSIFKNRLIAVALAVSILIPTGAFATQTMLVDDLYGSFENLKKHVSKAKMEGYLLLDAKLNQAKGDMSGEEFKQFKEMLTVITNAKLNFGDRNGNIDFTQVPQQEFDEIRQAMFEIEPYFDKLNDLPSSKELLTETEYATYIDTLMTYETIMAKSGLTSLRDEEAIPEELRDDYREMRAFLDYVNDKQMGE